MENLKSLPKSTTGYETMLCFSKPNIKDLVNILIFFEKNDVKWNSNSKATALIDYISSIDDRYICLFLFKDPIGNIKIVYYTANTLENIRKTISRNKVNYAYFILNKKVKEEKNENR